MGNLALDTRSASALQNLGKAGADRAILSRSPPPLCDLPSADRLLALDNGYRLGGYGGGSVRQQVLSEQALLHAEVLHLPYRMHPADLVKRFLDPVPGLCIVAHNLAGTHIAVPVYLPEYGGSAPHP